MYVRSLKLVSQNKERKELMVYCPLWSRGQSSWLHNGDVLCFLWGTNWIYTCYVEESRLPLCLVDRVFGYRSGGPGSIPGTTRFSGGEKKRKTVAGLERGSLSLVSTTEELLDRKVAAVYKTENMAIGIRHADHVSPSIRKSWQSLRPQAAVARSV
jgi:hypothetical protein